MKKILYDIESIKKCETPYPLRKWEENFLLEWKANLGCIEFDAIELTQEMEIEKQSVS